MRKEREGINVNESLFESYLDVIYPSGGERERMWRGTERGEGGGQYIRMSE